MMQFTFSFFQPAHELFRIILVWVSGKILGGFSRRIDDRFHWHVRHSAAEKGEFHLFLSDIDYSLIVPIYDQGKVARLKKIYYQCKKFFPWLGELEIYTEQERKELNQLLAVWGACYQRLRHFRKFNWMQLAIVKSKPGLSRMKYRRAMEKCLRKLQHSSAEAALADLLETEVLPGTEFSESFFFPYLGCWINATGSVAPYISYSLSPTKIVQYLALLPTVGISASGGKIYELRKNPHIRAQYEALTKIEAFIIRAVNRGAPESKKEMQDWEQEFWSALALHPPDL